MLSPGPARSSKSSAVATRSARLGGEADVLADGRREPVPAVEPQRRPQLERPEAAGELEPVVPEGEALRGLGGEDAHVVVGAGAERPRSGRRVVQQEGAAIDRRVQPLVCIDAQGVGAVQAGEQVAAGRVRRGGRAVGAIHVQPDARVGRDGGHRVERVDGAGGGRAGVGDDTDRQQAGGTVGGDRRPQCGRVEPALAVDGDRLHAHAQCPRRLADGEMRLHRGVDAHRATVLVRARHGVQGDEECGEIRSGPTADEDPGRRGVEADELADPAQRLMLDGRRGRTRPPRREVLVGRRRQQVRSHRDGRRRRLHVAEERRRRPSPGGQDGRARAQQLLHALAVRRQGPISADHAVDLGRRWRTLEHPPEPSGGDLLLRQGGCSGEQCAELLGGQIERGVAPVGVRHGAACCQVLSGPATT